MTPALLVSIAALLVSTIALFYSRRSTRIALLANAPEVFVQCGINRLDDEEDLLLLGFTNSGPTEALDVYVELYDRLDQKELQDSFTYRMPIATWHEARILAKSTIRLEARMIMYRGLGLDAGFYARGFTFAWVFWKDRLGNRHQRLSPVYDLETELSIDLIHKRHVGPTKVSPAIQLEWMSDYKKRRRHRRRGKPFTMIDPRIKNRSVYQVKFEPGEYLRPLNDLFPEFSTYDFDYPLITVTSEQEGGAPGMVAAKGEQDTIRTVWQTLQPWAVRTADTQIRLYRSSTEYDLMRIPWNHATASAIVSSIASQISDDGSASARSGKKRIRLDLLEIDPEKGSESIIISAAYPIARDLPR